MTTRRRGFAALLAMLFLAIFGTLAVAMLTTSSLNVQSSRNLSDVERARALAESGLRWQAYRFKVMARPKTLAGTIDSATAISLWPSIKTAILTDYNALTVAADKVGVADQGTVVAGPTVAIDGARAQTFSLTVAQSQTDPRQLIVTSTGRFGRATRKAQLTFTIDKKVKFAIIGKVPIQIGRNTIVEGNVAMAVNNKWPPIQMLSDFNHFDPALKTRMDAWYTFLKGSTTVNGVSVLNHNGYDNRIRVTNAVEYQLAVNSGFTDVNGDGYIDEYDLFVKQYDRDGNLTVSASEFTSSSTGQLYDSSLWAAIDSLGGPLFTGDVTRLGYKDNAVNNYDGYAKLRGTLSIAATEAAWKSQLAGSGTTIHDWITGTVAPPNPGDTPVQFGATTADLFDLDPANFDQCCVNYRARSGSAAGGATRDATNRVIANTTLTAADVSYGVAAVQVTSAGSTSLAVGAIVSQADFNAANATAKTKATATNGANTAVERTPLGSTSWQATYQRPIFRNVTFKNVIIPKGLNAVFDNCTFQGVTVVDTERNITKSDGKTVTYDKSDGMSWSQRMLTKGATFSANTAITSATNNGAANGNNLRFNDCTFNGPLAGNYATAYTHFANSWEFTGKTQFNNQVDQTATIVSPQVNIEMGSFSDPSTAPSTLIGVVVAGNIDIRGYSSVDGSIIVTGDGAGNTTLGYFGPSDGDSNPSAMPEGGYGKINIRYNPYRALPDGINVAIDILPTTATYTELSQ
jgi:Tfp pilus assembly protein PilX